MDEPPVLLSLGSINADFQAAVGHDLAQAETQPAQRFERLSGGKAANVASLARRLGHPAWLLGRVGRDDLAEQALAPLRSQGVDLRGVKQADGEGTAVALIVVPPGGRKRIVLAGEANDRFDDDADLRAIAGRIQSAPRGSVLVTNYEISPSAVRAALAAAASVGLRVVVDPSFPDRVGRADLHGVCALTPNREEALALAGLPPDGGACLLAEAAARLCALGAGAVCIKLDDGGCLLRERGEPLHLPAPAVDAVDRTGAGDAFTGAFAVALLEGRSLREAASWGVAAATVAVRAFGSQPAYPDRAALLAQCAQLPPARAWSQDGDAA